MSEKHYALTEEGLSLSNQYHSWQRVVATMADHDLTEEVRARVVDGRAAQKAGLAAVDVIHTFIAASVGERIPGMDEQARELVAHLMAVGLLHGQDGGESDASTP